MKKLLALSLFAVSLSAADLPKYWFVHIDHVARRREYERLHVEEETIRRDILAAHNVPRPPSWKVETNDGTYFSFRGRASLAEFEQASTVPEDVRKEIGAKFAPLEPQIHATLREHHSEIWQLDRDLTAVTSVAAPKFARLITDQVKTTKTDAYDEVMKRVQTAFRKNGIALVAFFSAYGDGLCRYLLMSEKPIDVKAIVGDALMRDWQACIVSSRDVEAHARPDLMVSDPKVWIQ
jgi:hypothetical protein